MSEKIEQFWRDATAEDVARVMKGEKVEARFRDPSAGWDDWVLYAVNNSSLLIAGWKDYEWFDQEGDDWTDCQVYAPPQWYSDKPDPGEGYRLLEKFPAELKLATDQVWNWGVSKWQSSARSSNQAEHLWYRRRIETIPEKTDSCVDHLEVGREYKLPSGQSIFVTEKGFEVL